MTDPIDTALLPCQFCGCADVATEVDRDQGNKWGYTTCNGCAARGPEVRTGYDEAQDAPWRAEAINEWNRRAPDTARQEGIALGLEMAAQQLSLSAPFITLSVSGDAVFPVSAVATALTDLSAAILAIPPHVAAARVLLDMPPNRDGLHVLPDHMRAALEQIAKG
jgi:Lar family restriction alleviation protein